MNQAERGFLLLTSHLGDPSRRVLTRYQLRTLARSARDLGMDTPDRELCREDLLRLGFGRDLADRVLTLLSQEDVLDHYLHSAARQGCRSVTRVSPGYPLLLRRRLGLDSPGCLWCKGDPGFLELPGISLVGSRELEAPNRAFAQAVGRQAALQGLVLISGNARGADRAAQDACLEAGGRVISVVADRLDRQKPGDRICYVSEESFDEPFSTQRALSRNRVIHCLGRITFVAQCRMGQGGTWDGTQRNLQNSWSNVACFRDGSKASLELEQMGAFLAGEEDLQDLSALCQQELSFFQEERYEGNRCKGPLF